MLQVKRPRIGDTIPQIPLENNMSQVRVRVPQPTFSRIPPNQGVGQYPISGNNTMPLDIMIPADAVWNPAESILQLQLLLPEDTAGAFTTWVRQDLAGFIQQVTFSAVVGGSQIVLMPYAPWYQRMYMPRKMRQESIWTRDYQMTCFALSSSAANAAIASASSAVTAVNAIIAAGLAGGVVGTFEAAVGAIALATAPAPVLRSNGLQYGGVQLALSSATGAASGGQLGLTPLDTDPPNTIVECGAGPISNGGHVGSANILIPYSLKLGDLFPTTFLGMKKNIYLGAQMKLTLLLGNMVVHAWSGTSVTNPATGAATRTGALVNTFSNMYLQLQTETDAQIANDVKMKAIGRGMLAFPYVQNMQFNRLAASPLSVMQIIDGSWGSHLIEIMWSAFNPSIAANTALDNSNIAVGAAANTNSFMASKILQYNTQLGAAQLQPQQLQCDSPGTTTAQKQIVPGTYDDWLWNKRFYEGTPIGGLDDFRGRWAHIDCFGSVEAINPLEYNQVSGIPLSNPLQYQIFANINTAINTNGLNIYAFGLVWKRLIGIGRGVLNVI